MDRMIGAEVAEQAAEIERVLGSAKLRRIAEYRAWMWLDRARAARRNDRPPDYAREKAFYWAQVQMGRLP